MADNVQQIMDELGQKTPEEIAAFLEGQGIKGLRGKATRCPIAKYLAQQTGQCIQVGQVQYAPLTYDGNGFRVASNNKLPTPLSVGKFVAYFDDGDFAQLRSEDD